LNLTDNNERDCTVLYWET